MPIEPHRIEAAARAIAEEVMPYWSGTSIEELMPDCRRRAALVLEAAFPELAAGTAWVAPWEPTEEMEAAERETGLWAIKHAYPRARDAHLSKGKDDDG